MLVWTTKELALWKVLVKDNWKGASTDKKKEVSMDVR